MKELITMDAVASKLYDAICNMKGTTILERCTFENDFCHFIVFRNSKGCWVVYTNQNYLVTDSQCPLRMYHMRKQIPFARADSKTTSFNQTYCKLCEESTDLIANYSSGFTIKEIVNYIKFA